MSDREQGWVRRLFLDPLGSGRGAARQIQLLATSAAFSFGAFAVIICVIVGVSFGISSRDMMGVGITSFLVIYASGMAGGALGFLFGLPRIRSDDASDQAVIEAIGRSDTASRLARAFAANDSLTRISDWLTTIVVGLTLINLSSVRGAVEDLADVLETPLGGGERAGVVGVCMVIGALVSGFIISYVWTSVSLRAVLEESEAFHHYLVQRDEDP